MSGSERMEEIRKRVARAYQLEAERHYSLETGCDSWLELKKIYAGMLGKDVPYLLAEIEKRDEALSLALWALEDVGTKSAAFWYEDAITAIRDIMGGKERGNG